MTLDKLEAKALADKVNEHEVTHGALLICWDGEFEYYEWPKGRGEPISIDRDEAIDLLASIEYNAHKKA